MSLNTKFTGLLSVSMAFILIVNLLVQRLVIFPSFVSLEKQEAFNNINRVDQAIRNEIEHLNRFCADWAIWDDTYEFIGDTNSEYISSNLPLNTFIDGKLNLTLYINKQDETVFFRLFDLETGWEIEMPEDEIEKLKTYSHKSDGTMREHDISGIVETNKGAMLISSRPILKSDGTGPSIGSLIMGRFLNKAMLEQLEEQTKVDFTFSEVDHRDHMKEEQIDSVTWLVPGNENTYLVHHEMKSINRKNTYDIETIYPREISQNGQKSMLTAQIIFIFAALIITLLIYEMTQKIVIKPINAMTKLAKTIIIDHDYALRLPEIGSDEIGMLGAEFNHLVEKVEHQTAELQERNTSLAHLARIDGLTGLFNRRTLDETVAHEWKHHLRNKQHIAVILCDIDFFKKYNDFYGHQQGDDAIRSVADALKSTVLRATDGVFRYGGEEFCILLPESTPEGAKIVAERVREKVEALAIPHVPALDHDCVTVSLGISCAIPSNEYDPEKGIQFADEALYEAKNRGRNCSVLANIPLEEKES